MTAEQAGEQHGGVPETDRALARRLEDLHRRVALLESILSATITRGAAVIVLLAVVLPLAVVHDPVAPGDTAVAGEPDDRTTSWRLLTLPIQAFADPDADVEDVTADQYGPLAVAFLLGLLGLAMVAVLCVVRLLTLPVTGGSSPPGHGALIVGWLYVVGASITTLIMLLFTGMAARNDAVFDLGAGFWLLLISIPVICIVLLHGRARHWLAGDR